MAVALIRWRNGYQHIHLWPFFRFHRGSDNTTATTTKKNLTGTFPSLLWQMLVLVLLSITNSLREINIPRMTVTFDQWPRWMKTLSNVGDIRTTIVSHMGPFCCPSDVIARQIFQKKNESEEKANSYYFWNYSWCSCGRQVEREREKNKRECLSAHELLVKNEK